MIDIETLGLNRGCVVLEIGAVMFDEDGIDEDFQVTIDIESSTDAGLEINGRTLSWWMEQDEEAQDCLTGGRDLHDALAYFSGWYLQQDAEEVWANSPSMDCEILEGAYEAVDMTEPWDYDEERDFRTLEILGDYDEPELDGVKHDALYDARRQALIASQILTQRNG